MTPFKVETTLLYYALLHNRKYLIKQQQGSTFKAINKNSLEDLQIKIPPKELQAQISNKFERIQDAFDKVENHVETIKIMYSELINRLLRGSGNVQ